MVAGKNVKPQETEIEKKIEFLESLTGKVISQFSLFSEELDKKKKKNPGFKTVSCQIRNIDCIDLCCTFCFVKMITYRKGAF